MANRTSELAPLHRMLAHVEALGLGHRPDPDDAGRHFSTCPVCSRPDALVIFEPDDFEPVRIWCSARCHQARLEQALASFAPAEVTTVTAQPDGLPNDPALLRRQGELLLRAADFLERREAATRLRAVA
jgi:hypothetical protein